MKEGRREALQYTKESVRAKILAAAEQEFDEQGYAGASMRSIVRRAETSLGNIYRYYPNKEALFLSIVEPVLDRCIDQTGSLFTVTLSEVERNVPLMVDFVAEHSRVFRIVQNGPPEHYAASWTGSPTGWRGLWKAMPWPIAPDAQPSPCSSSPRPRAS